VREANRDGAVIGLIIWALFVAAGYFVGKQEGRVGGGVALAALLGVAGGWRHD
jgi:hypothetical protein